MVNIGKDESIITQAVIHWACLIPHVIFMTIGIGFITIIFALIRMFTTKLILTSKRVYGEVGLINTKTMDAPLNKVNTVSVERGLFGKIFGYGNLHITTSSGSYNYKGIKSPSVFRDAIMEQIDVFDDARIKKQAAEMAAAIK